MAEEYKDPFGDLLDERSLTPDELKERLTGVVAVGLKGMKDHLEDLTGGKSKWCVIGIVLKVVKKKDIRLTIGNLKDVAVKAIVPGKCVCRVGDGVVLFSPKGKRTVNPYTNEVSFGLILQDAADYLPVGNMQSLAFCPVPVFEHGKKRPCNAPVNTKVTYQGLCSQHLQGGISRTSTSLLTAGKATGNEFFKMNPNKTDICLGKKRKLSEVEPAPPTAANLARKARYMPKQQQASDASGADTVFKQ
eukprot:TRINITY_DN23706_c0_g1_i1.p3 TRINITY_DN23706_c0_g1~~TRINITY_DN23706_c0_g1_i1.p3  ORF type:complete len:247 (+),score=82.51 TRINITY_DN23706_c0_g1_i1:1548-2288(+)